MKSKKLLFQIVFILFCQSTLDAQIKFIFLDKQSQDLISDVQLVTGDNQIFLSNSNGEIVIQTIPVIPLKVSRIGFSEVLVTSLSGNETKIELTGNKELKQVDVFGKKEILLKKIYGDNSVDKEIGYLKEHGITDTKEVLRSFSELQIKDYGGSSGFQTFSARGTTASQNIVVIDGMIVNDMTSGLTNLSLIPISGFKQIAVQTGGFSADVANGGFGSTVYLESGAAEDNLLKLGFSGASFGESKITAEAISVHENNSWFVHSEVMSSDGDFKYDFLKSGKKEIRSRKNNQSKTVSGSGGFSQKINDWKVNSILFLNVQQQGIPGPVFVDNEFSSDAELGLAEIKNITSFSRLIGENIIRFSSMVRYQKYDYSEKMNSENEKDFYSEKEIAFRGDYLAGENDFNFNSGFYFRFNQFNSNRMNFNVGSELTDRFSIAFFSAVSKELKFGFSNKLSARFETANQLPSVLSGSYSLSHHYENMENSISLSRMMRYPSFSELHFVSIGYPKLIPEKYWGIDFASKYQNEYFFSQIKGFAYLINDKIISIPKNAVQWTTLNLDEVRGFGIEQNIQISVSDFQFDESVCFQSIRNYKTVSPQTEGKKLIYTPLFSGSFSADYSISDFKPFVTVRYTGDQFYSPENLENEKISEFWILNIGLNYQQSIDQFNIGFQFQIKNILDQKYEWVKSFPQPGRSLELSCQVSL